MLKGVLFPCKWGVDVEAERRDGHNQPFLGRAEAGQLRVRALHVQVIVQLVWRRTAIPIADIPIADITKWQSRSLPSIPSDTCPTLHCRSNRHEPKNRVHDRTSPRPAETNCEKEQGGRH